jgi:hypothetical protein
VRPRAGLDGCAGYLVSRNIACIQKWFLPPLIFFDGLCRFYVFFNKQTAQFSQQAVPRFPCLWQGMHSAACVTPVWPDAVTRQFQVPRESPALDFAYFRMARDGISDAGARLLARNECVKSGDWSLTVLKSRLLPSEEGRRNTAACKSSVVQNY